MTLAPLDLAQVCGVPLADLEAAGQLSHYSETGERDEPATDDTGFAEVLGITEDANGAAVELEYYLPNGASLLELGWTLLLTDADGVIIAAAETGLIPAVSPEGATSTGTVTALPDTLCATGEALPPGTYDLVAVAEAHGTRASGTPYLERTTALAFPVELGEIDPEPESPLDDVFTCNEPGPDSIHTLPDALGLTLAVDLPAGPWASDDLPEIPGVLGTADGRTILATIGQGVHAALVDADGVVVGFVHSDSGDAWLAEIGPERPVELGTPQLLTVCNPDGSLQYKEGLEGTYTVWPFDTATLKEIQYAGGTAESSSETVIVIANPQEVTFTK
ncbi:MAG: hypothetical protein GX593_05230 [Actinomycetales bacterium]|nr:hypothetical protein [Actinomycetales bacterium]